MKFSKFALLATVLVFGSTTLSIPSFAYEVETHAHLSRAAFSRSILSDPAVLRRIGLYPEAEATWIRRPDNGVYQEESYHPLAEATIPLLLKYSVRKEDHGSRALQHFFDPQNDRGQTIVSTLTDESEIAGLRSWQWTLRRMPDWTDVPTNFFVQIDNEQYFTAEHAKDYFEQAILSDSRGVRSRSYGQFISAIGHVIHHVQDMAQPDHVRNDSHCNVGYKCIPAELFAEEDIYDPSTYEPFVLVRGYDAFNQWNYPIPQFDSYKAFWTTPDDAGMADFTNRFAVSKDTNFRGSLQAITTHPEYPYPSGVGAAIAETGKTVEMFDGTELTYVQSEIRSTFTDNYLGTAPENSHLTATHSLFALYIEDAELLGYEFDISVTEAMYSIGHATFESAASQLLPRAEAYSAGLINYMLRGRLGVQLPDRGYYALTDFNPEIGFTSLRFKLQNETPDVEPLGRDPVPQDIGAGEIVAVVSYRPNPCFEDDLSGELHVDGSVIIPSGCTWDTWSNAVDEVRVSSSPVMVDEITREWNEYEFDFSASPIPFSARDVEVYFMFRGDLGSEQDAIIVERKNISEPSYFATLNSSDYFWTGTDWKDGFEADRFVSAQYHDMSYDYDLTEPYTTGQDRLNAAHFQRIVALVDPESDYQLRVEKDPEFSWLSTNSYDFSPLRNETREVKTRRSILWFGTLLHGPERYSNKWCDDEGCTLSGLKTYRGTSQWSLLRQIYAEDIRGPLPEPEDWEALEVISESDRQSVTVHE